MKKTLVRTFAVSIAILLGAAALPSIAATAPSVASTGPTIHQVSTPAPSSGMSSLVSPIEATGGNTTTKGSSDPCYPITPHNWAKCGGASGPG